MRQKWLRGSFVKQHLVRERERERERERRKGKKWVQEEEAKVKREREGQKLTLRYGEEGRKAELQEESVTFVLGGRDENHTKYLYELFHQNHFRVSITKDAATVEVCGAIKVHHFDGNDFAYCTRQPIRFRENVIISFRILLEWQLGSAMV